MQWMVQGVLLHKILKHVISHVTYLLDTLTEEESDVSKYMPDAAYTDTFFCIRDEVPDKLTLSSYLACQNNNSYELEALN